MKAMGKRSIASFLTVLLNVAWGMVALGLALATLLLVVFPFVKGPMEVDASGLIVGSSMTIPVSFSVDAPTHRVTAPSLGIEDAQIQNVRGLLRFPARSGAFVVANTIILIFMFALALWVLGQLRAVFRTLRDGQPFVPANATRIRRVAMGVIAGELARASIVFFENYYAMTHFAADGLRFNAQPDLNLFAIVDGLIILVIAEVFRAGTRLAEDQSLTV
ncbi:MAG TPA: DUF2975 domain-containing protein [Vicinamibacterales bacterium]|jgi:hypothetical protein